MLEYYNTTSDNDSKEEQLLVSPRSAAARIITTTCLEFQLNNNNNKTTTTTTSLKDTKNLLQYYNNSTDDSSCNSSSTSTTSTSISNCNPPMITLIPPSKIVTTTRSIPTYVLHSTSNNNLNHNHNNNKTSTSINNNNNNYLEDSIVTPVISNRLQLRGDDDDIPPLLCLPPSSFSLSSTSSTTLNHHHHLHYNNNNDNHHHHHHHSNKKQHYHYFQNGNSNNNMEHCDNDEQQHQQQQHQQHQQQQQSLSSSITTKSIPKCAKFSSEHDEPMIVSGTTTKSLRPYCTKQQQQQQLQWNHTNNHNHHTTTSSSNRQQQQLLSSKLHRNKRLQMLQSSSKYSTSTLQLSSSSSCHNNMLLHNMMIMMTTPNDMYNRIRYSIHNYWITIYCYFNRNRLCKNPMIEQQQQQQQKSLLQHGGASSNNNAAAVSGNTTDIVRDVNNTTTTNKNNTTEKTEVVHSAVGTVPPNYHLLYTSYYFGTLRPDRISSLITNHKKVNGIRNYGQTCFLNSVLQALASLDPFIVYLDQIVVVQRNLQQQHQYLNSNGTVVDVDHTPKSLICEKVLHLLLAINNNNNNTNNRNHRWIDPRPILYTVGQKYVQFRRARFGSGIITASIGEQQDAQEFLQAILGIIIDEGQFHHMIPPITITPNIVSSFLCKSNDSVIDKLNLNNNNDEIHDDNESLFIPNSTIGSISKAMEIMMTTTSSTSPCPLSVWCGSALMCATCHKVRPIQNVPFLDIPIIPTATSASSQHHHHHRGQQQQQKYTNLHNTSCRLEDCLAEFISIERVVDVECRNCTIQSEIQNEESEKDLISYIINGIASRRSNRNNSTTPSSVDEKDNYTKMSDETKPLLDDLQAIEKRIDYLRRLSPDDDSEVLYKYNNSHNHAADGLKEETPRKIPIPLKRSAAYKCLILTRLPAILSIHVQRRYYDPITGRTSKTMQHVNFPEMLDISPFCAYSGGGGGFKQPPHAKFAGSVSYSNASPPNSSGFSTSYNNSHPIWYKIMAIIEHRGGPYSGHYVCYRRDPARTRGWLFISDDIVRTCSWNDVRNCQAYMLFYEAT